MIPDYHYSFRYQEELSRRGWRVRIFVPYDYPSKLLYKNDVIREKKRKYSVFQGLMYSAWLVRSCLQFKYLIFYGKIRLPFYMSARFPLHKLFRKNNIILEFAIMKIFRKKLIFLPSGCHDEFTKNEFSLFDNGNVCDNCGFEDRCNDDANMLNFEIIKKYFVSAINLGFYETPHYRSTTLHYKCIDIPSEENINDIPTEYRIEPSTRIKVMHASSIETRQFGKRNIKGTPALKLAIDRLVAEGFEIEFHHLKDISASAIRFLQAQADIYVDQLVYGMWGSSAIEAMSLGKPVICYVRADWGDNFLKNFGYEELPVLNANVENIYFMLKYLIEEPAALKMAGEKSKEFCVIHYNVEKNVEQFVEFLLNL